MNERLTEASDVHGPSGTVISQILDSFGKLSYPPRCWKLSLKFTILAAKSTSNEPGEETPKMSIQEASHRVRIVQELDDNVNAEKPRKFQELRWKEIAKHTSGKLEKYLDGLNAT